jgi:hypothetical protein
MHKLGVKSFVVAAALAAVAIGCGDPPAPTPHPLAVTPALGPASQAVAVTIVGTDFTASTSTDFEGRDPSTLDARFQATLGVTPLRDVRLRADGALTATVPEGIPVGVHDLSVVNPDGREGRLAGAYRALADTDAAQLVASYRVEPIGPQQAWAPFEVTITALDAAGATVGAFNGAVTLSDLTGTAVPGSPALFRGGVWTGTIEVRSSHPADVLAVADALGHGGASAPFAVAPTPPAALRFVTPPRSAVAGSCSGAGQPLTIEVIDAFGLATVATAALSLTPTAFPGLGLFADDACSTPVAAPVVAAGTGSVTVWFRATRAGGATVELSAPAVAPASQVQSVAAGPGSKLVFVTPPQTLAAGSCSQVATLEVRDAWDNPATSGPVALALDATPTAGFGLYADATCATPASSVSTVAATARGDFWFRGTTAQTVDVTASGAALAGASQAATITSEASASRLAFLTPSRTATAGACSGDVTVQSQDSFGNAVVGASPVPVALAATPASGLAFFSDAACSVPLGGVAPIAAGQSAVTFHFRGTVATAETVDATAAGLVGASQGALVVAAAPARLAFITAPQSVMAGACSAVASLELRDAFDNVATAPTPVAVALAAAPSAGFAFYADAACATPASSATIAAGASGTGFHFRAVATGDFAVTAADAASLLASATQTETITPAAVDHLDFLTSAQTVSAGLCSGEVVVQSKDSLDNVAPVTAATTVNLSAAPSTGFTFYSDAGCATLATSVTIAAGGTQQRFWFRGDAAGSVVVTASDAASLLASTTQAETITPAAANHLDFLSSAQTVTAGVCSGEVVVQSKDSLENVAPVTAATTVNLTALPPTGFTFYSDAGCSTLATSVTIAAGVTQQSFWFRGNAAGSVVVTAADAALVLGSTTQTETIIPAAANHLDFLSSAQTVTAGVCSGEVIVESKDSLENVAPVSAATTVNLTAAPSTGFTFYSDAGCSTVVTSVSIPAGVTQQSFWFRGNAAGSVVVTAADAASVLTSATQTETILPAAANHLDFLSSARTVTAGVCSGEVVVQSRDSLENVAPVAAATIVNLTATPSTGFTFYSDAGCSTVVTSVGIAAGGTQASFWFRGNAAGSVVVTAADAASVLTSATQTETLTPAAANHLDFLSSAQTVTAGLCSGEVVVQSKDSLENVAPVTAATTVNLTALPPTGFTFYSDAGCSTVATSVGIAAGGTQQSFWFRGDATGSVVVTAADAASLLASATQTETITPAAANHLDFLSSAQTVTAGVCSGEVVLQSKDFLENVAPVAAATTVNLAALPPTGFTFYSDAGCSTVVTSVSIAAGVTQQSFWFRGNAAGSVVVTAADAASVLTSATQTETITPAAANHLDFLSSAQTVTAGVCSGEVVVQSKDSLENVAPVSAATTVNLTAAPSTGFTFYSDAGCATLATSVSIAAGGTQASFWFRGNAAGSVVVTASDAASLLASATQTETLTPAPADRIVFLTPSRTAVADECSLPLTVELRDPFGNPVVATSPVALTVTALPVTGTSFFADSGCTIPLAPGAPAIVVGSSTATFRFKGTVAGTFQVTVAATGLTAAVQNHTVVAAAPAALAFATAEQTVTAGLPSGIVTVELRDAFGNVALAPAPVALALAPTTADFGLCGDAGCVTPITGATIATSGSATSFWFRGDTAGSVVVAASDVALLLGTATQTETIQPAAATHLIFESPPQTVEAGSCSAPVTLRARDAFENDAPVGAATTVNLSLDLPTGVTLYEGAGCVGAGVAAVVIPGGTSAATLSFRSTAEGAFTLTAHATGMTTPDPAQLETIEDAPASALEFVTPAQTVKAGDCAAVTVRSLDAWGNPSDVVAPTAVALEAAPAGGVLFFSDAACSTAITETAFAAGAGTADFYFQGTTPGSVTVTASVLAWPSSVNQTETVLPGDADHFAWDPVSTPQPADRSIPVRITALDAFGNVATAFAGTADLSLVVDPPLAPVPALTCTSGCAGLTTTTFSSGVWTGALSVSEPASPTPTTPDRSFVATSATVTGASNGFAVVGIPIRSPPTVSVTATPAVVLTGDDVLLDASGSTDYQTPAADLLVSWDFLGTATAPPPWPDVLGDAWTPWSTLKSVTNTFSPFGTYTVRVAVRDADGDVGYGVVVVRARGAGYFCTVNTASDQDDASVTSCDNAAWIGDGRLSFREALRVAGADETIGFASPMTITGSSSFEVFANVVEIQGPGVVIKDTTLVVNVGTSPVLIRGLEFTGAAPAVTVMNGHAATLQDVYVHDSRGIESYGAATLERVRMERCSGPCVAVFDATGTDTLTVSHSQFIGSSTGIALDFAACDPTRLALVARSSLFTGFDQAIRLGCGGQTTIQHNTFEANGTGVAYFATASTGHSLRNNIFTNHSTSAVARGGASFTDRDYHLLWQNVSDGGLGADPNALAADPLYLFPAQGDFRLALLPTKSSAVDSAVDLGLRLLPAFPTAGLRFLGTGPDRGAYESW